MSGMFKNPFVGAVIVGKTMDHFITSADTRETLKFNREQFDYTKSYNDKLLNLETQRLDFEAEQRGLDRDLTQWEMRKQSELNALSEYDRAMAQQAELSRYEDMQRQHDALMEDIAAEERESRERMHTLDVQLRERVAEANRQTELQISREKLETKERMVQYSLQAKAYMQQQQMTHDERLLSRQLEVQRSIAEQQDELQRYLSDRNIQSQQELARFTALANRETQILVARETAQNMLQDRLVQNAMKDFPLDIAPLVLLGNKTDSLDGLLRFSTGKSNTTNISTVYRDVKRYAANPEPLKIFVTPIRLSSDIKNREQFSKQIWDCIYQNLESFFTENYDRRGTHPVVVYPTAWKEHAAVGLHACETLHYFLHDIPCVVIEPKFDGSEFRMLISAWQLGYTTTDHVRTEMKFDVNLDLEVIKAAYERSLKSIALLDALGKETTTEISCKRKELEDNIRYYKSTGLDSENNTDRINEVSALGIYNIFHIEPQQDLKVPARLLSDIICLNLGVLVDSHHLLSTDADPVFPQLFKESFPKLYDIREIRQLVYNCYEKILISLRNQDSGVVSISSRRQMERTREMQMANLKRTLELIDDTAIQANVEDKVSKYCREKYNRTFGDINALWDCVIDNMDYSDLDFFNEILQNISDRRIYKKIDRKMSLLRNR